METDQKTVIQLRIVDCGFRIEKRFDVLQSACIQRLRACTRVYELNRECRACMA
jgi:hypothetical protein